MITRENYEIYFMDYLDGVLPGECREELRAFLLANPDLEELLDGMDGVRLQPEQEVFGKKEELKRHASARELAYHAIAEAEGVITEEERQWVRDNAGEDEFGREVAAYRATRVQPDRGQVFGRKDATRRYPAVIVWMKRYAGVAAVAIFAVVLVLYITREREFSPDSLPQLTARTEPVSLPELPARVTEPEKMEPRQEDKPRVDIVPVTTPAVPTERVEPVNLIESAKNIVVHAEILPPRPNEMLVSPYEGVRVRLEVKEQRPRPLRVIAPDLESSDNILSSIVNAGRNVVSRFRNREEKDEDRL